MPKRNASLSVPAVELDAATRQRLSDRLTDTGPFALAFSGGGDSLALLTILAKHPNLKSVLIVDHGLRPESAKEAHQAKRLAKRLGHTAKVLTWTPEPNPSGLQARARKARYGLLGAACREQGIKVLASAHHADDQAETILMRLERGTGWRGAAGMAIQRYGAVWPELAGITLVRPALDIARFEFRSVLEGQTPIEDRSNEDRRFTRIRARDALKADLELRSDMLTLSHEMAEGLNVERLEMMRRLRDAELSEDGQINICLNAGLAAVSVLAPIIGGTGDPVDRSRLRKRLAALDHKTAVALGAGCIGEIRNGRLILSRDPVAINGRRDGHLPPTAVRASLSNVPRVWDGRFLVSGTAGMIEPVKRGRHVGFHIVDGENVRVESLVKTRLAAYLQTER